MDTLFINRKLGYFRWTAPTVRLTLALLPDLANFKQISTFTIPKTGSTTNNEATCKVQAGKVTGTLQFLVQGETYQFEARIFNWTFAGALSIDALLNPGNTPPANQAPSVIISGSASGTVGTQQSFQAIASDGDGTISKVELLLMADASTLTSFSVLDTDLYSPYVLNWTPSSAGNFPLRTRATDDDGATSFSSVLQVAVVVATQNPDPTPTPAGTFTITEPRYVSTVLETTDNQFVHQLREGELLPAGTYPLTHDGTAADGSLLPLPATSYQVRAYSHKQSGAVADVFKGAIGNSSKYPAGNRGSRGFNPPDASLCVVLPTAVSLQVPTIESTPENPATQTLFMPAGTAVVFEVYGYTEGSLGVGFYLLTEPNVLYALPGHEASKLSGTHLAVLDNTLYVGTLCVFGVYDPSTNADYTGPGVLAIDLATFQDKTFDGNPNARTLPSSDHTYHLLATKHTQAGGKAITSLAAANGKLFVSFGLENRVQVIETSGYTTLQQNTITYPFASAASGSTLWLAHEASFPEAVEQYTVNADGTFTRTATAGLTGITHVGYLAYSWDQQTLLAMDVAENTTVFFGSYTDQGELLIPRRIYYLKDRTFRYVGAAGQYLTRAQWDALPDTGNEVFQAMATFMPSTTTHRLRLFNASTGASGAVYGEGDYVTNALVTNMKWMFCSQEGIAGDSENCFVCGLPDGGTLLRDKGNSRSIRLNASGQYVSRKSSTGSTYNIAGDSNDPTKHWIRLRRYWQDLNVADLTLDGVAWGLEANYTAYSHPAYPPYFSKQVVTTNGRTFAFRRNSYTYQQVLWEVSNSGLLNWNLASKDLGSAILPDGSWLEVDNYDNGSARRITQRFMTGSDVNGRPQIGPDTVYTTLPDQALRTAPRLLEAPTRLGANGDIWVYDGGKAQQDTDRGGLGAYHVGRLQAGQVGYNLQTMPATEVNVDMENPPGNIFYAGSGIQNAGTFSSRAGDLLATWRKDEFGWGGNNNHAKFYWKGVFMFEYGLPRYGAYPLRQAEAGSGGNGDSGYLTQVGQVVRCYNGGEWGNGVPGINVTEYHDFLPTLIEHTPVALTQWTPKTVRPGYSLMDESRWVQSLAQGVTCSIVRNQDKIQSRGTSRRTQFDGLSQVNAYSTDTCTLEALPSGLTSWLLDGQLALRQVDDSYHFNELWVNDTSGRKLFVLQRVRLDNGLYDFRVNGQSVNAGIPAAQQRAMYWLRDFSLSPTSTGLRFQHASYPAIEVAPLDSTASLLAPGSVVVAYKNFGAGGGGCITADLNFMPIGTSGSVSTGGGSGATTTYGFAEADPTIGRVDTSKMQVVNVGNANDLRNCLAANLTNTALKLQDGDYTGYFEQTGAWNNVMLVSESGNARLLNTTYSTCWLFQGGALRKNIAIRGAKMESAWQAGNYGDAYPLLWWNELPQIDGLELSHLDLTVPGASANAMGCVQYSTSSQSGSVAQNIFIHHNLIHDVGRCGGEFLSQGYDGIFRLKNFSIEDNTYSNLGLQNSYGMAVSLSGLFKQGGVHRNNATGTRRIGYEFVNVQQVVARGNNLNGSKDGVGLGFSDDQKGYTADIYVEGGLITAAERPFYMYECKRIHLDGKGQLWQSAGLGTGANNGTTISSSADCTFKNLNILTKHTQLETGFTVDSGTTGLQMNNCVISTAGATAAGKMPANESLVIRQGATGNTFTNVQTILGQQANGQTLKGNNDTTGGGNGAIVNLAGSTNIIDPSCTFSTAP